MKKIALSPGDPAGIGPEICLKSLEKNKKSLSSFELIGDINFYKSLAELI
tara:strand:- start:31 stop:180 length:150 start_codon:yes stop_codon:yes gene_type:complete